MAKRFRERTAGEEPRARFTPDSGVSEAVYVFFDDTELAVNAPTDSELRDKVAEVLGGTLQFPTGDPQGPNGPGSINRFLPIADPRYPCNFCDDVEVLAPPGELYQASANTDDLAAPVVDGLANYFGYELRVKFSARPYALFENDRLTQQRLTFYDEDGLSKTLYYYREWLRFCHPLGNILGTQVSATQASAMRFRATGTQADNTPFSNVPSMAIPDTEVILRWYGVPARYVTHANSYLSKYVGYINQTSFAYDNQTTWTPGQLLFMGAKTLRAYNQPSPFHKTEIGPDRILGTDGATTVESDFAALNGTFGGNPLVDLDLRFILTTRTSPIVTPVGSTPNPNWVPFGHNLGPYFPTRKFYYATTGSDSDVTTWVPSYLSVPMEVLFQDPDAPGVIV